MVLGICLDHHRAFLMYSGPFLSHSSSDEASASGSVYNFFLFFVEEAFHYHRDDADVAAF